MVPADGRLSIGWQFNHRRRRNRSSLARAVLPMGELVELVLHVTLERAHLFRGLGETAAMPEDVAKGQAPTHSRRYPKQFQRHS